MAKKKTTDPLKKSGLNAESAGASEATQKSAAKVLENNTKKGTAALLKSKQTGQKVSSEKLKDNSVQESYPKASAAEMEALQKEMDLIIQGKDLDGKTETVEKAVADEVLEEPQNIARENRGITKDDPPSEKQRIVAKEKFANEGHESDRHSLSQTTHSAPVKIDNAILQTTNTKQKPLSPAGQDSKVISKNRELHKTKKRKSNAGKWFLLLTTIVAAAIFAYFMR